MIARILRLASALALVAFVACNIQPQPLPPGVSGDDKGGGVSDGEPGSEAAGPDFPAARDAGAATPPAVPAADAASGGSMDAGVDGAARDAGDAGTDGDAGPRDGGSDAPSDASTDGPLGRD